MKGDVTSLRQAHFSEADMGEVLKLLWDHSRAALEATGFSYHQRRGSEKSPLAELVVNDLYVFCEAVDLLKLSPIATDLPAASLQESN